MNIISQVFYIFIIIMISFKIVNFSIEAKCNANFLKKGFAIITRNLGNHKQDGSQSFSNRCPMIVTTKVQYDKQWVSRPGSRQKLEMNLQGKF